MNRLNEIEARANAATEGPWFPNRYSDDWEVCGELDDNGNPALVASEAVETDAEFIAHARTDVPWLLEQVKLRDKALEAVLEMHELAQPITAAFGTQEGGDYCRTCVEDWPCPTVEAIRQHLGDDL